MPPKIIAVLLLWAVCAAAATFDFVETPIGEVAHSISLAYETPILVDHGIENKVTFHLENVGVLEGLAALCESQGLQLSQVGKVFRIKRAEDRGENFFSSKDSLVTISVRNKDVLEFIREYSANTGLNILPSPSVTGRISGDLRDLTAVNAFRGLLESQGFRVWEESGCLRVDVKSEVVQSGAQTSNIDILKDGDLYSANLNSAPLADVLLALSRIAGLNLAMYGDVQEQVRLNFSNVTLNDLVESIFKGSKYVYELAGGRLYVAERGAKNALSGIKLYSLRYLNSEKALQQLGKFLPSTNFVVSEVKEQNALLLGGSATEVVAAESLLTQIDVPAMQVTLACVLVEFKRGKSFEIGLHSGAARKTGAYDIGVRGFYDFLGKDVSKSGAFGKIGILPDRFEMELSSLEENNQAEVLARPKLTTLNGNKAELNVTNTVYYLVSQVSADGYPITDYRSFNDGISLELTPWVTREGSVTLEVAPEIKTAGRSTGDGPRDISTRNLKTSVVLKNGETLCLGGLRRKSKSEVRSAVPFLGSLPVIGRLFCYTSEVEEESELAIFITPEVKINATANDMR
ncbi:MAG: type II and III secretion system protein [Fibrobacter sp.]|nr:type II and III secretion system protein [Fibrobacter sp.]